MRKAGKLVFFTGKLVFFVWSPFVFGGGCQPGQPTLIPVSGKVAYKGSSLPGGIIVFTPDSGRGTTGPLALGKINPDGSYQLYTGEVPGAPAGWYRVTLVAQVPAGNAGQSMHALPSLIPEKYRDPDLSKLTCEVKANRANAVNFNLD